MFHFVWLKIFIQPIYNLLILCYLISKDLGLAIVIVTVIIRLLLYPLFKRQFHTQRELNEVQKEINKLRIKYKNNPRRLQEEMIRLYQERGVAPWSGCLPLILQLPIFIAIYQVFRVYLTSAKFSLLYSFIPHPSSLSLVSLGFLHLDKPDFYVLPYLVGITQYLLTKMTMGLSFKTEKLKTKEPSQVEQINKITLYSMPLFLALISFTLPSAIVLYFLVSNIFSIIQSYVFYKKAPLVKIKEKNEEQKHKRKS